MTASAPRLLPDPDLRARCTRFLSGHGRRDARFWLDAMAGSDLLDERTDEYSEGPAMRRLEGEVARLLGKEAGAFFHKGVAAQQAALLAHTAGQRRRTVAVHPKSHVALDEMDALDLLSGLTTLRVGRDGEPFTLAELERLGERPGAVVVEVPLRRAAFRCPPWEELVRISDWARRNRVPLHLDGARLWEAQPWYGRPLDEIAALFDSVYVSFYKGLGGMGGCVLAGTADLLAAAAPWRTRFGGNLWTAFPLVLTAWDGLHRHLPSMSAYHARAVELAAALAAIPGVRVAPEPPHCNSFQVLLEADVSALEHAAVTAAHESGTWLFGGFTATGVPGIAMAELVVGEATMGWSAEEAAGAVAGLLAQARG